MVREILCTGHRDLPYDDDKGVRRSLTGVADRSQYGYSLDYRRMTIGPGFDLQSSVMSAPKYTRRLDFTTGKR